MTYEAARQYLARVVPWPQDDGEPSFVNLHWMFKGQGYDKPGWSGRATRSVDEAIRTLNWTAKLPDTRDIYVCLSGQREAQERTSTKGKPYLAAVRSQNNVTLLKSLWLDLDVKEKGGYPDLMAAVAALGQFVKTVNLPRPTMMVRSGGGLHVYWVLSEAITLGEWQPLANALANAAKQHGLLCDTGCTVDSARILRVPGTKNFKLETPRDVTLAGTPLDFDYAHSRIADALAPYVTTAPSTVPELPRLAPLQGVSDLAAGIETSEAPVIDIDTVAPQCGFIKGALDFGGRDFGQPLWNLTTLIATFTKGGRTDAHRMAGGHAEYDIKSTDELFDRKERERQQKGLGWPSCQSIRLAGCSSCDTCPLLAQGKTPLHFAVAPPPPRKLLKELPEGYSHDPDKRVLRSLTDDKGITFQVPVCKYPMYDACIRQDTAALQFTSIVYAGEPSTITVPFEATQEKGALLKVLARSGIVVGAKHGAVLEEFIVSWVQRLQAEKEKVQNTVPYGWNVSDGELDGFSYGGMIWTKGDPRRSAPGDSELELLYQPTGKEAAWRECSKMITDQERPELNTILATAFAAPLVRMTGHDGMFISCYSQGSGLGKSTAMKVSQAVWGEPRSAMQGLSDTQNAVFVKLGQLRSLPVYWDEIKSSKQVNTFVEVVFQLTGGREKARATQSAGLRRIGTWQTLMISASNESMVDHVIKDTRNTTAGMMRVFEFEVTPRTKGAVSIFNASRMVDALNDNYGAIGLAYAEWLGANHERLALEMREFAEKLEADVNLREDERYWGGAIACVCLGARYANELGFTEIDEDELYKFMLQTLERMRGIRAASSADIKDPRTLADLMSRFLTDMRARHTVRTNIIHQNRGAPRAGAITDLAPHERPDSVLVQIGRDDKSLRIQKQALREWLTDRGYAPRTVFEELEKQYGAVDRRKQRLCSGTRLASGQVDVIDIDLTKAQDINPE